MNLKSVTLDTTKANAFNIKMELESESEYVTTQLDPFLIEDFSLAIGQVYHLQILSRSNNWEATTYKLKDALIDPDVLVSYETLLPLRLEVELDGKIDTLEFNISQIDPDTDHGLENPRYYIYCDNSEEITHRFWFLKKS